MDYVCALHVSATNAPFSESGTANVGAPFFLEHVQSQKVADGDTVSLQGRISGERKVFDLLAGSVTDQTACYVHIGVCEKS